MANDAANPYDAIPYLTRPCAETHPDRLAAVATLFGMTPAPIASCRVLEIGCGDGSNLVPLAYALPQAEVVGVDLAEAPIAAARQMAAELGLRNVRLVAADLRAIDATYGEFDYIVAHGVYSWVPADVRDALLGVASERLAPAGVAFVSYNAYPGRHMRQMLREMMLYEIRDAVAPARRVERARGFLETIAEGRMAPPEWRELLAREARILLDKDASSFYHDDLAPINHPVYFHEFAAHAARHGLEYLGDADTRLMFDPRGARGTDAEDPIAREQQLDFLRCRRFRETLLCRNEVVLNREPGPAAMRQFLFAAPARRAEDGSIEGLNGVRISPGHAELESIVAAIGDAYPLPASFEDLVPYAASAESLEEILFALIKSGFATFHLHDFPCEETVTEHPKASALARWQAKKSNIVANACHTAIQLEESDRALLLLLDGTRTAEEIGRAEDLAWFARMGLLEG